MKTLSQLTRISMTDFTFTITRALNGNSGTTTVDWAITGTGLTPAVASDFVGGVFPSGRAIFTGSETDKVIRVRVKPDSTIEPAKDFTLTLSNPVNGVIVTASASGTILDDDAVGFLIAIKSNTNTLQKLKGGAVTQYGSYSSNAWLGGLAFEPTGTTGVMILFDSDAAQLLRTTDGGVTWTLLSNALATDLTTYRFNLGRVLAYGGDRFMVICPVAGGTLMAWTSLDGQTWTQVGTALPNTYNYNASSLFFTERGLWYLVDKQDVMAVSGFYLVARVSSDQGVTWNDLSDGVTVAYTSNGFFVAASATITLLAASYGQIWKHTTGTGSALTIAVGNFATSYPTETGTIVGLFQRQGTWILLFDTGSVWRSVDDGSTWIQAPNPGQILGWSNQWPNPIGMSYLTPTSGYLFMVDWTASPVVKVSADLGDTWAPVSELLGMAGAYFNPTLWVHPEFVYP
jgi:hypothetical protein